MEYEYMKRFEPENYTIHTFDYWVVLLRKRQVTLGSVIVALRREVPSFSMVSVCLLYTSPSPRDP